MKKPMTKILLGLLTALLVVVSGCGKNQSAATNLNEYVEKPDRVLKFTDQNSEDSPTGMWEHKFADLVKKYTKGHIQVKLYFNNTLCGYDMQPLQAGIVDFIQYVPSSASDLDSRLGAFDAPYLYRDPDHRLATFNPFTSKPLKIINESLKDDNVMLLSSFCSGYRQITCNFPIHDLKEIQGAKIRVVAADVYQVLFSSFGAAATPMAFSEVSTALVTHVIDGQENPYSVIATNAFYEIQKYLMETNHLPTNHGLWMNRKTFDSLPPEHQKAVMQAAYDASAYMDHYILNKNEEYKKQCADNGMQILTKDNGLKLDEFEKAAKEVYVQFKDKWKEMPDTIRSVKPEIHVQDFKLDV